MIVEEEEKQLETCAKKESLPTSKAAFKKHPRYVLASCLIVVVTAIFAFSSNLFEDDDDYDDDDDDDDDVSNNCRFGGQQCRLTVVEA
jgi:hypothetical protein